MLFTVRVIIQYDAFQDASGTLKNISVSAFKGKNKIKIIKLLCIETFFYALIKTL